MHTEDEAIDVSRGEDDMKSVIAAGSALLIGAGATLAGLTATADAAKPRAKVTVTITQVNAEMSGKVKSPKAKCKRDRLVSVIEQIGTRGGGDDVPRYEDTTSLQNGKYVWNTGNTGVEGFFYAKVAPKKGCKGDKSPTIEAVRNP